MIAYQYKAISPDGATVSGVVEAYDEFEAVAQIKETCSIVLKVTPVAARPRPRIDLNEPLWISDKTLAITATQFSILLRSGLPMARTVEVIARQTGDRMMKRVLTQVSKDVAAGYPLSRSLQARGKKIPLTFIETVRAGEDSGTLEESFRRLADHYEKSHKTHSKVKNAMAYPAFLVVLAFLVITLVVTVTVPVVAQLLPEGARLPGPTRVLLQLYELIRRWWWLILGVLAAAVMAVLYYGKTERGRFRLAHLRTKLPVLGPIALYSGAAQFANTLSTLLTAGLPLPKAMTITARVLDNYAIGSSVGQCVLGVEEGKPLGEVLRHCPYLPPLLVEMAAVGEASGSLEETLATIGRYFEEEAGQRSARALARFEPVMMVVLGLIIGFIVIALYMPIFTMYSGMV